MTRFPCIALACLTATACAGRPFTTYLVEPAPVVAPALQEPSNTSLSPRSFGSTTAMTVSWNDGEVLTQVQIPMLASGQRIVVEHAPQVHGVQTIPATSVVPPPPRPADGVLDEAYRDRGLTINDAAAQVSISEGRQRMQQALDAGNLAMALEWCTVVLNRYPSHPETLRAKGSILLLLGERDKAIETYETAQAIEYDAAVDDALQSLFNDVP